MVARSVPFAKKVNTMDLMFLNYNLSPILRVINFAYNNNYYLYPISCNFIPEPSISIIQNVPTGNSPAFCFLDNMLKT